MMIFSISLETITIKSWTLNQKISSLASFSAELYNFKNWGTPKLPSPPLLMVCLGLHGYFRRPYLGAFSQGKYGEAQKNKTNMSLFLNPFFVGTDNSTSNRWIDRSVYKDR